MSKKGIAVIAGDGIGKEVMPEGIRVMEAAASKFGIDLAFDHFDFASWDYFEKHGKMMPDDWKDQIGAHDAIYFGAVGWPEKIPDHVSLWGSLLLFRREFDQYINLRPARLMPGIIAPVVRKDGTPRAPGEIDMYIVRENTEGEYSSIGGRMYSGTEREIVMQETVMSRLGVDRVLKFAFELAMSRPKKHLTSATKSNGIAITMPYWDERVAEMAKAYPAIRQDKFHIDILTAHFVQRPDFFDVVSRKQKQQLSDAIVEAALRANTQTLPAWLGVDLGSNGYAVVKVEKVLPRETVDTQQQARERQQYMQWWAGS